MRDATDIHNVAFFMFSDHLGPDRVRPIRDLGPTNTALCRFIGIPEDCRAAQRSRYSMNFHWLSVILVDSIGYYNYFFIVDLKWYQESVLRIWPDIVGSAHTAVIFRRFFVLSV